ncbi:alpha-amylase family glycosyl hydrolase [Pseudonocardia sp. Cha107L01]|uniref:alpha-amylase family glycosyl hydrolase n=1 Tax=Pseudonocardia sp. Cha107L01 TaxID=3457576 RepID=UPI00403E36B0
MGDFAGMTSRLDYLSRLGVTTIWLNPIHPSPRRDGGYDITDHYGVHPQFGSLGDFCAFLNGAGERGIRVMLDFVANHTSDQHPWFTSARRDRDSPFRDVWSDTEPPDRFEGQVFPGDRIRCRSGRRCGANRCTHGVLDCVAEPFEGLLLRGPEHDAVLVGDCLVGLLPDA